MPALVSRRPISLQPGERITTPVLDVDPQTAMLVLRLKRPTGVTPLAWPAGATLQTRLVLVVDGVEYAATGQVTGGMRAPRNGRDRAEYVLTFEPPWGFFGQEGPPRRIGQTARQAVRAYCEVIPLRGAITTEMDAETLILPAPAVPFHGSVAFHNASSAGETDGDGTLSVSHTISSGTDRAVFVSGGHGDDASAVSSTYAGNAMTSLWFLERGAPLKNAAFRLAGDANVPTGAQTAQMVFTAADSFVQHIGVISMTGVDGTTPVGTPATGGSTTGSPSVTVSSPSADSLVVDTVTTDYDGGSRTVGADQTARITPTSIYSIYTLGSSQLGSAGGAMTWTFSGGAFEYAIGWDQGAVEFKPVSAGGTVPIPVAMRSYQQRRVVV